MHTEALRAMQRMQAGHWWWRGMRHVYRAALRRYSRDEQAQRVLDVGCGFGANLPLLAQEAARGGLLVGVDVEHDALHSIERRAGLALVQARADALPFRAGSFDTVALLAVIEHVPDDQRVLSEAWRIARPGARQLLLTSAFMLLWSHHDVANGHLRRYRVEQVEALQAAAGWRVKRAHYLNAAIFPLVLLVRRLQGGGENPEARYDMGPNTWPFNRLLEGLLWLEARLPLRLPFGVDIFCAAVREQKGQ
ncbi:MAG: class I SAM-dependent methyltransferase [Chloroflexi bacterium]|nr:class I SAM-dependent methyltransferase [Chloroflexota bacterium]